MSTWAKTIVGGAIATALGTWIYDIYINSLRDLPPPIEKTKNELYKLPKDNNSEDYKYVIPVGLSTKLFVDCLKNSGRKVLLEDKDFKVDKVSSIIRLIVPISKESIISENYENCLVKLKY